MKKEKSIQKLEAKGLGGFTKIFGKKVLGGEGAPTKSIPEIVIKPHKPKALEPGDGLEIDDTNDGPY